MKLTSKIIIIVGVCVASFAGGVALGSCQKKTVTEIEIVYQDRPIIEYKYIKIPMTCEEFKKCYESPIKINGSIDGVWMIVLAQDSCKKTTQKFKLNVKHRDQKNIILLNYVHMFSFDGDMGMGANISYYRKLLSFNNLSFGVGGGATMTSNSAGIQAGVITQF